MEPITTNILRADYKRRNFSYGNPTADRKIVFIGSCRIVPFLNLLRLYNSLNGDTFQLQCYNPVEMWDGPGHEVSDGVNNVMAGHQIGRADFLICEHLQYCGALNTVKTAEQNIYDTLGCQADVEIRLPNWNDIHIFDNETAGYDREVYAKLALEQRVEVLREQSVTSKERFLSRCRVCSFPELEQFVADNWLTTRLGWTSNHPTYTLFHKMFGYVAERLGLNITEEFKRNPLYSFDIYESTGMKLTKVDYEANGWQY